MICYFWRAGPSRCTRVLAESRWFWQDVGGPRWAGLGRGSPLHCSPICSETQQGGAGGVEDGGWSLGDTDGQENGWGFLRPLPVLPLAVWRQPGNPFPSSPPPRPVLIYHLEGEREREREGEREGEVEREGREIGRKEMERKER